MNTSGWHLRLHLKVIYLRFKYPLYFRLPAMQIYALHTVLKFFKILKPLKIDFFLVGGSLLGAVRQESFAGRPTDVDLGIKEEYLPKLLNAIPLLIKNGATFIRSQPPEKTERVQIFFGCLFLDVGVYRKEKVGDKEMWMAKTEGWDGKIDGRDEYSTGLTFRLDNLVSIKAYGKEFLAPANPEIYLEKKYGKNWKIPDKKQFLFRKNKFQETR